MKIRVGNTDGKSCVIYIGRLFCTSRCMYSPLLMDDPIASNRAMVNLICFKTMHFLFFSFNAQLTDRVHALQILNAQN